MREIAAGIGGVVSLSEKCGVTAKDARRVLGQPVEREYSLEELLRESDVVSVHCPLTEETRDLIDEAEFRLMKPTAYLVNTARGNIVNEIALEKALAEKRLAGAALDVLSVEPGRADHPLFKYDNFLCTPHMAWHSTESAQELKRKAAEEVRRVLRGEAPLYQVNKF